MARFYTKQSRISKKSESMMEVAIKQKSVKQNHQGGQGSQGAVVPEKIFLMK